MEDKKLVGFEVVEKSVDLEGQELVGKVAAQHVGKLGSLKISVEGKFEFLPSAHKAIDVGVDWLEKKIPGDQKAYAEGVKLALKGALAKVKI